MNPVELYANRVWPFQRHFVKKERRCDRCFLKGDLQGGLCESCRHPTPHAEPALCTGFLVDFRFDESREYVLLLSCGKDGAYILDRLRREQPKLRITCVLVNTGFMSPLAIKNAVGIAERTKTDLLIVNSYIGEFRERMRSDCRIAQG